MKWREEKVSTSKEPDIIIFGKNKEKVGGRENA